ncbi:hypothetical protein M441DRAFT_312915 [Trichoderma asperellum CBS 433.97]|uniref:Uncharacterized protein n=1 Tax=Trichoderma asperellum (strain ATCC 204424 / CBS 433.97 / NBRC 101777) TaxID=1042311 RepID=A0A2T3ZKD7_TRIA4|nr:hypothetical protein M441DRAFT_312915 [Trichoderma asperellum CBS 433.97]PTB45269.1 hypothetical protein M441DRAFT_312915 [Trichoderma asperellum CBS 433.97]
MNTWMHVSIKYSEQSIFYRETSLKSSRHTCLFLKKKIHKMKNIERLIEYRWKYIQLNSSVFPSLTRRGAISARELQSATYIHSVVFSLPGYQPSCLIMVCMDKVFGIMAARPGAFASASTLMSCHNCLVSVVQSTNKQMRIRMNSHLDSDMFICLFVCLLAAESSLSARAARYKDGTSRHSNLILTLNMEYYCNAQTDRSKAEFGVRL